MNIYIVDDKTDVHVVIALALRSRAVDIISFRNPIDFVEHLSDLAAGVVLLDYQMKPMNGLEVKDG